MPGRDRQHRFRTRHTGAGRCRCGQPRRPARARCSRCLLALQATARRRRTRERTARQQARLAVDLHGAEWTAFCAAYEMPLAEALEAAMELLMATTWAEEKGWDPQ